MIEFIKHYLKLISCPSHQQFATPLLQECVQFLEIFTKLNS